MLRCKVASIAWISAVHGGGSGGGGSGSSSSSGVSGGASGGGLLHASGSSQRGSGSLLGNRRGLLLLRGVLGFGAGSTLYWTVGSYGRLLLQVPMPAVTCPEPTLWQRPQHRVMLI